MMSSMLQKLPNSFSYVLSYRYSGGMACFTSFVGFKTVLKLCVYDKAPIYECMTTVTSLFILRNMNMKDSKHGLP